jgi:hypothetical protein
MPHDQHLLNLLETIRWLAQTNHQAHHQNQSGTFQECPLGTCRTAAKALRDELATCGDTKRTTDWYLTQ